MPSDNNTVSSEIFEERDYVTSSRPSVNIKNVVSKFEFTSPENHVETDSDGDLIVPRKNSKIANQSIIEIEHRKSTRLDLVGLQVWRGSLLLADWLIHNQAAIPEGSAILELASGVGLTSVVASMFAPVYCTDVNKGNLLKLIKGNVERNKHIVKHPISVLELDFMSQTLPGDIEENLLNISIIIAADTVYDDTITEAFVRTVQSLLSKPPEKSVYVALEKRYVFTIADCDSVAPCYEFFLTLLDKLEKVRVEEVPLDFPQFFNYDRVKELVIWKLTSIF